jgi:hypothetical protein
MARWKAGTKGALTAGGDVAGAEVADHVDAGQFGEQGRVVQLERIADAIELARPVAHRLAVGANGDDPRCSGFRSACHGQQLHDDLGIATHQGIGAQCRPMDLVVARRVEG